MDQNEIWKEVPGFPDYKCSSIGRILSKARGKEWKLLKLCVVASNGYYMVGLGRNNRFTVHSLIALTFFGPSNGLHVNHKNGVKTDNSVQNLEYVTLRENNAHALLHGLINNRGGNHGMARFTDIQAVIVREAVKNGHSQTKVAMYFKSPVQTINGIVRGRSFKHLPI